MHSKVSGDLRDWALTLQRKPHAALDELIGVLLRTPMQTSLLPGPSPSVEVFVKPARLIRRVSIPSVRS